MSSYSGYGPPPWGDAAAHALSDLSLGREEEERSGEGPPRSDYPPSFDTSNPPTSQQGLPYPRSPICGVVAGRPYAPPSAAYPPQYDSRTQNPPYEAPSAPAAPGAYPPSIAYPSSSPYPDNVPHSLNLPENLDVSTGGKGNTPTSTEALYPPRNPRSEGGYPPASSLYPPNFDESSTASQGFPQVSPYEARAPAPAAPYSQSKGYDGQGKEKTKKEFDSAIPNYDGSPSPQPGYPPPGSYPSAVPMGYPPQPTAQSPAPARYPGQSFQPGGLTSESSVAVPMGYPPQPTAQSPAPARYPGQNFQPGGLTSESSASSVNSPSEGSVDSDRGYKKDQQYGYGAGYPQRGYDQPGYSQPGYGPQPTYPQPGDEAYPPQGYAPRYPPAYPGVGYAPEGYPSADYGAYGYAQPVAPGGRGGQYGTAPAPPGAYGAPIYGSHGEYKQHKGGHKGHKHKKMKKMKKGYYAPYDEGYGHHGRHHGHHGHHGKHGKHKHKH